MSALAKVRQIFQMQLALNDLIHLGWVFSDETSWFQSPSFTLPWRPDEDFNSFKYVLPGEFKGEYRDFELKFNGSIFLLEFQNRIIRFAIHDPLGPLDFRGLPFLRSYPYVGKHKEVLEAYNLNYALYSFLPLMPLDLLLMDELYLNSRLVLVGVTAKFGLHIQPSLAFGNANAEPDDRLVAAAQRGEAEAFQELVTLYTPLVFRLSVRMLQRKEDAEDLTQEVFLAMYRHLHRFNPDRERFKTWLMNIATQSALDYIHRSRTRVVEQPTPEATTEPEVAQKAILELDPALRAVFVLQELEQLSASEVGNALGLPESEVKSRLRRAHDVLRERLHLRRYEFTNDTIKEIRKAEQIALPEELERRLHEQVQRWLM